MTDPAFQSWLRTSYMSEADKDAARQWYKFLVNRGFADGISGISNFYLRNDKLSAVFTHIKLYIELRPKRHCIISFEYYNNGFTPLEVARSIITQYIPHPDAILVYDTFELEPEESRHGSS
jgi:hypothetical protein